MKSNTPNYIMKRLELCMLTGEPYVPQSNTTLNHKYGVGNSYLPNMGYPKLGYYSLGILPPMEMSGMIVNLDIHKEKVASVYAQIPLAIKDTEAVFDDSNYFIKKMIVKNGKKYFAYYAKRITSSSPTQVLEKDDTGFNTMNTNSTDIVNPSAESYASVSIWVSKKIIISLDENDIKNLLEVFDILGSELPNNIIGEIGLVTGIEYDSELHSCQTVAFASVSEVIEAGGFINTFNIDLGNMI